MGTEGEWADRMGAEGEWADRHLGGIREVVMRLQLSIRCDILSSFKILLLPCLLKRAMGWHIIRT